MTLKSDTYEVWKQEIRLLTIKFIKEPIDQGFLGKMTTFEVDSWLL